MLVIDNGDAIRGIAEVATQLDFVVNGYVGTTATQLADGQMASTEGDLYASGANATVVTSITITNTDSAARTFTLYLKPSAGTSRAISPVSLDLGVGYSFYTDGQRMVVLDKSGGVVTTSVALSDASPNTIEPDDSASAGTGTAASRADHEHAIVAAAPSAILEVQAQAEGSSTSFARADHDHAIVHDITDNSLVTVDGSPANGEYLVWTANGLDGKSLSEFLTLILASALPENITIILDALLSGDEKWSGISEIGTMGYGATVGDLVYLAVADTKWELAKADVAATSKGKIGLVTATTSENSTCQVLLYGKMRSAAFPAFTVGAPVHVGLTAGDVQVAAPTVTGDIVRIIGYGNTAEDLFFCPDNTYIELA